MKKMIIAISLFLVSGNPTQAQTGDSSIDKNKSHRSDTTHKNKMPPDQKNGMKNRPDSSLAPMDDRRLPPAERPLPKENTPQ
ncbi:MAG: hypothetical protein ABIT58_03660 [Ferruginibacter sp.]